MKSGELQNAVLRFLLDRKSVHFYNNDKSAYGDAADTAKAVCWADREGILNGGKGKLMPKNPCTRAQLATILLRYDGLLTAAKTAETAE